MTEVSITKAEFERMLEKAVQKGAQEALKSIGMDDDHAFRDMYELRDFVGMWRNFKKEVIQTTGRIVFKLILWLAAASMVIFAVKTGTIPK